MKTFGIRRQEDNIKLSLNELEIECAERID